MKILQSTIERLLYGLVVLMFIATILAMYFAYQDGQIIKQNQAKGTNAIKTYIACLLTLSPTQTPVQIKVAEQVCFDKAPTVKS